MKRKEAVINDRADKFVRMLADTPYPPKSWANNLYISVVLIGLIEEVVQVITDKDIEDSKVKSLITKAANTPCTASTAHAHCVEAINQFFTLSEQDAAGTLKVIGQPAVTDISDW